MGKSKHLTAKTEDVVKASHLTNGVNLDLPTIVSILITASSLGDHPFLSGYVHERSVCSDPLAVWPGS